MLDVFLMPFLIISPPRGDLEGQHMDIQ
jgi:hypothetical protein